MERIKEELDKKRKFAEEFGYNLDENKSRILIDKLLNKTNGICPCKTFRCRTDEDKKNLTCPCVECHNEIKEKGKCTCGMFFK